ncbi:MAG: hypothetical protein VR70_10455 [Rhodospirillaceae bacterium BRH_c57]|nr:MAG: hypothetical protein VR70_10455 [Rhodospirillaceae bacterium BRH_c57]
MFTCKDAIRLAVLESDGLPNPKFGHHGLLTISLPEAFPLQWMRAKAFDDGVYVFGMSRSKGNQNALLYKFLPNGDIDPSFGLEGCVTLSQSAWFLNVNDIERMSDGRLVIGGYGNEANVLRLYEDGSPDMSFGNNGFIEFRASGRSTCKKVALIDDSILIAGDASDGNSRNDIYVAKLMPDGRPDLDFHGDGYLSLTIKYRDNLVDFAVCGSSITLLCQSDCDAPRHFRSGLARVHL